MELNILKQPRKTKREMREYPSTAPSSTKVVSIVTTPEVSVTGA
jgi:hypothetical protein